MEECIICFEETSGFMFYNCSHKVCKECYPKIKICPVCKTPLEIMIVQPIHSTVVYDNAQYKMIFCISICFICGGLYIFTIFYH